MCEGRPNTASFLAANENAFGHSIIRPSSSSNEGEGVIADLQTTLDLDLHRYPDPSLRNVPGPEFVLMK
jgi:histidinol-phosphate aminotransferase